MFVNRVPSSVSSAVSVRPVQPVVPASAGEPGRPVASRRGTRRDVVRGLLASAVAVALTPVVAASRPPHPLGPLVPRTRRSTRCTEAATFSVRRPTRAAAPRPRR